MQTGNVKVHLEYTAVLKLKGPPSGTTLDLPEGTTTADLLRTLHIPSSHQSHVAVFVNGQRTRPSHVLKDGDRVHLAVPMSGG